jgi:BirA family biotin operon repressor/biotin-[acetyl-CoA-carboxylase] ligase
LNQALVHRALHFERIDSTNAEARRLAEAGERGPVWIRADEQTGGRGRLGRSWVSELGNCYATFMFPCEAPHTAVAQLSFVAAVAVHDAVVALLPHLDPRIKWPNDLLLGGAKFCGILSETVTTAPLVVAIGCGINVAHAPQGTPYPVASLESQCNVDSMFEALQASLSSCLQMWSDGTGFPAICKHWQRHAIGLDADCTTEQGAGIFRGLAEDGGLILERLDGSRKTIHSGDVRFASLEAMRQR